MEARRVLWLCCVVLSVVGGCADEGSPHIPDNSFAHGNDDASPPAVDAFPVTDAGVADDVSAPPADAGVDPELELELVDCRPVQAEPVPARTRLMGGTTKVVTKADMFEFFLKPACGSCHVGASLGGLTISPENLGEHAEASLERMRTENRNLVMPQGGPLLHERAPEHTVRRLELLLDAWLKSGKEDVFPDPTAMSGAEGPLAVSPALGQALTNLGTCIPAKRIVGTEVAAMQEMDAKFASMTTLPSKLSETDLFTLDSEPLAKHGVLSFAPGYTLWADDAKKMRYIRVPQGQSIAFSVATQSFDIPENTRFYKTFLKEVVDLDGQVRYKRIETRLIVARRAVPRSGGQEPEIKALFGTYKWNEEETEAELESILLNNGQPFRDDLTWYLTNEREALPIIEKTGSREDPKTKKSLLQKGFARHYAIPGSERCKHCHLGGPDGKFVLGFLPLQIWRRPQGEGGVIDPTFPDELTQLQRFMRYGLITGISAPEKLLPLEKSQGGRAPRNNYELTAQGYMLGNCAHCHNPDGYATLASQGVLRDVLNFFPNAAGGGIFQFPLERVSPRIRRGTANPEKLPSGEEALEFGMPYITPSMFDHVWAAAADLPARSSGFALAPWRSLIYRNVASNFTYAPYQTIYPHMPLDTPGVDCRLPRIMAEWMVSIPARTRDPADAARATAVSELDQPYEEVRPGDPDYAMALLTAELRVLDYRADAEYAYCYSKDDIVDTLVLENPRVYPEPHPDMPHWVVTDLTEPPGPWQPRYPEWQSVLRDGIVTLPPLPTGEDQTDRERELTAVMEVLRSTKLTEAFHSFARTPLPMGVWVRKPECAGVLAAERTAGSFTDEGPGWRWLSKHRPDAPVYMQSPGAAVYGMVCQNCHGPEADSNGRQADTVAMLSGGLSRVANFRGGLFGPVEEPGRARHEVFSVAADAESTVDDWTARYVSWMALGGTTATIPDAVLNVISMNPVMGKSIARGEPASANMLAIARSVCRSFLELGTAKLSTRTFGLPKTVVADNGDADLWRALCTYGNPAPVRALQIDNYGVNTSEMRVVVAGRYRREGYPASAAVMDQTWTIHDGISDANTDPACLFEPPWPATADGRPLSLEETIALVREVADYYDVPVCPPELFAKDGQGLETHKLTDDDELRWELQGAANAGFAVFTYLDDFTQGRVQRRPEFDRCEQLLTP